MKKILLIAAMAIIGVTSINAQYKPEKMSIATELNYSGSSVSLPEYGARVRMFLNENMVVRLGIGFNTSSNKTTKYEMNADPETETYTTTTTTQFSILPGFEYHFSKFERVSPYVGAEIGFLTGVETLNEEYSDSDNYSKTKSPTMGFRISAIAGVDVHIYKGFYLGAELGLGYNMQSKQRGETTDYRGGVTVEQKGDNSSTNGSFGFIATPALRIGWFF